MIIKVHGWYRTSRNKPWTSACSCFLWQHIVLWTFDFCLVVTNKVIHPFINCFMFIIPFNDWTKPSACKLNWFGSYSLWCHGLLQASQQMQSFDSTVFIRSVSDTNLRQASGSTLALCMSSMIQCLAALRLTTGTHTHTHARASGKSTLAF